MQSILVGHDGSPPSEQATAYAAELARAYGARLVLLRAVRPTVIAGDMSGQLVADLTAREVEIARGQVAEAVRAVRQTGTAAEPMVLEGESASVLSEFAREHPEAGLIVVGAHGKSAVQRAVLGSTTFRLMHLSPVPVLVSRTQGTDARPPTVPRRILVPVDFSEASMQAARLAADLCRRFGAQMELLHAWTPPWFLASELRLASGMSVVEYGQNEANAGLTTFVRTAELGPELSGQRVLQEPAAPAILRIAAQENFDLVVMGTHGRGALKRLLLGNTAHKTVVHAPCPVLAVPGTDRPALGLGEVAA